MKSDTVWIDFLCLYSRTFHWIKDIFSERESIVYVFLCKARLCLSASECPPFICSKWSEIKKIEEEVESSKMKALKWKYVPNRSFSLLYIAFRPKRNSSQIDWFNEWNPHKGVENLKYEESQSYFDCKKQTSKILQSNFINLLLKGGGFLFTL